jgi:hypothetical protein
MTNVIEMDFEDRRRLMELAEEPTRLDLMRAALVDSEGLQSMSEPIAMVGGMLFRDSIAWLYGAPGSCKTFIALDLAGCVGTGENWQGTGPTIQGTVLYVVAEGVSGIRQRVRAWESSMGMMMKHVHFLPLAVQVSNAAEWDALIALAVEIGATMIVLDTQARVAVGLEENSATEMGRFVQQVERLRKATAACVLVVHHSGRTGEHMRGSVAIDGAATTIIKVTRSDEILNVECTKQKDAPESDAIRLRLVSYETSAILSGTDFFAPSTVDSPATRRLLVDWWDTFGTDWVSTSKLVEVTGASKTTLWRNLKDLVTAHIVESKGESNARRYRLRSQPLVPSVPQQFQGPAEHRDIDERGVPSVPPPFRGGTVERNASPRPELIDEDKSE